MRNAWNSVLKATAKQTQEINSERSDGVRGIVDTDIPRMTAKLLVNELLSVLYTCRSEAQLYRPTSVVEMATITIDMIRIIHSSTESIINKLLHLGCLTKHGIYQRTLNI